MRRTVRPTVIAVLVATGCAVLSACGGGGNRANRQPAGGTINVAIVDNPNEEDLAHLTASLFTAKTGIRVNYTILGEGTLREVVDQDLSTRHCPSQWRSRPLRLCHPDQTYSAAYEK